MVSEVEHVVLFIDMQKLITITRKIKIKKASLYLTYWDADNLYGWVL